jgi:hypothetical protein
LTLTSLGLPERAALIILAASRGSITNAVLSKKVSSFDAKKRGKMQSAGLIAISGKPRSSKDPITLTLTDAGWEAVEAEMGADVPPRAFASGQALWTLLAALKPALVATGGTLRDLLTAPTDLRERIAAAYSTLAPRSGDWVAMVDLRGALADVDRETLDETLREMRREKLLRLTIEEDQSRLTKADRAAAVRVGPTDMHFVSFD